MKRAIKLRLLLAVPTGLLLSGRQDGPTSPTAQPPVGEAQARLKREMATVVPPAAKASREQLMAVEAVAALR